MRSGHSRSRLLFAPALLRTSCLDKCRKTCKPETIQVLSAIACVRTGGHGNRLPRERSNGTGRWEVDFMMETPAQHAESTHIAYKMQ